MRTSIITITTIICLTSCAQTIFYRDGKKLAVFQGDMTNVNYTDKDIRWTADIVNHSSATKAQGEAATSKITAAGASGLTLLLK